MTIYLLGVWLDWGWKEKFQGLWPFHVDMHIIGHYYIFSDDLHDIYVYYWSLYILSVQACACVLLCTVGWSHMWTKILDWAVVRCMSTPATQRWARDQPTSKHKAGAMRQNWHRWMQESQRQWILFSGASMMICGGNVCNNAKLFMCSTSTIKQPITMKTSLISYQW